MMFYNREIQNAFSQAEFSAEDQRMYLAMHDNDLHVHYDIARVPWVPSRRKAFWIRQQQRFVSTRPSREFRKEVSKFLKGYLTFTEQFKHKLFWMLVEDKAISDDNAVFLVTLTTRKMNWSDEEVQLRRVLANTPGFVHYIPNDAREEAFVERYRSGGYPIPDEYETDSVRIVSHRKVEGEILVKVVRELTPLSPGLITQNAQKPETAVVIRLQETHRKHVACPWKLLKRAKDANVIGEYPLEQAKELFPEVVCLYVMHHMFLYRNSDPLVNWSWIVTQPRFEQTRAAND